MVVLDWETEKLARQPDNLLKVPKFSGDSTDRELYDLLPFLERKRNSRYFRFGVSRSG